MKGGKFLCDSCKRSQTHKPRHDQCARCNYDATSIAQLVGFILRVKPHLAGQSPAVVLALLWKAHLDNYHDADLAAAQQVDAFITARKRAEQLELFK